MKIAKNRPAITIVGHVCIDHNYIDGQHSQSWGSAVIYIANYLKYVHGIDASIAAPYGADLTDFVDTSSFVFGPTVDKTLIYENTITQGRRSQSVSNHSTAVLSEISDELRSEVSRTDILIFAPLLPNYSESFINDMTAILPENAFTAILPQGYYRHVNDEGGIEKRVFSEKGILQTMNLLIQSDEDSDDAVETVHEWVSENEKLTGIVTHNSDGATILGKGRPVRVATRPVPVKDIVNSVGAGDIFGAELLLSIYAGHALDDSVANAQEAARQHILGKTGTHA